MNLVKQRNEWRKEMVYGSFHSELLEAYRNNRDGEYFRMSETVEQFCEYILFLEERCKDMQEKLDWYYDNYYDNTGEE